MNSIKKIMMAITVLLSMTITNAQIKNAKTETVKIYGNCGMCKLTIEKAGNLKKVAQVNWNKDTKMATITYDAKKTNQNEILKRIALAGYDSDSFLAPDAAYNALNGCCQYERTAKVAQAGQAKTEPSTSGKDKSMSSMGNMGSMSNMSNMGNNMNHMNHTEAPKADQAKDNQLKPVFDNYFLLKDALVKTDGKVSSATAKDLLATLNAVKMEKLAMDVHMVWMNVMKDLKEDAEHISETQDPKHQRDHFVTLSKNIYALIKVSKMSVPVYYNYCPMFNNGKGANWLSKENTIKNPYYGSQMLSCGKTVETIK